MAAFAAAISASLSDGNDVVRVTDRGLVSTTASSVGFTVSFFVFLFVVGVAAVFFALSFLWCSLSFLPPLLLLPSSDASSVVMFGGGGDGESDVVGTGCPSRGTYTTVVLFRSVFTCCGKR
jgi:hypothetical protein